MKVKIFDTTSHKAEQIGQRSVNTNVLSKFLNKIIINGLY